MTLIKTFLFLFSLSCIISGCNTKIDDFKIDPEEYKFFPLKIGNTWKYKLDSIIYDNKGTIKKTVSNIIIEKITESFMDNEGETNYIIERTVFENGSVNNINMLNAYINNNMAIRNEGNLKFIKLVFPVIKGKSWDGNALFDSQNTIIRIAGEPIKMYELWDYRYSETGKSVAIEGKEYKDVLSIIQTDTENSIEKRYSYEEYAKGIGLIYKKMMILNTQKTDQASVPWELKAEEGFILEQKLLSFESK